MSISPLRSGQWIAAICFDFGDTLSDEGTQMLDDAGAVTAVKLLPGAVELIAHLSQQQYPLALVADCAQRTSRESYRQALTQAGILQDFHTLVLSVEVGVEKPDRRMFAAAVSGLGLEAVAPERIVFVGNRLERDILGANRYGMTSVLLTGSPRYRATAHGPEEHPQFTIAHLSELVAIIDQLDGQPISDQA